jgi:hypothetical protein
MTLRSLLLVLALLPAGALAHHGWSHYDQDKAITLTGTVRSAGYEHPHGHVQLQADGKLWQVTLAPPSRMERRGLAREALVPGITATVVGYRHRDHADELRAETITIDGKTTELR